MIQSMTAYASRTGALDGVTWLWEVRGVNARGLDVRLRLPDGLGGLEVPMRAALKETVSRGNIAVGLRIARDQAAEALQLDQGQLDRVLDALDRVQEAAFAKGVTLGQPTAADVLAQRGVVVQRGEDDDHASLLDALTADIAPLLADFAHMRRQEGQSLERIIAAQCDEIAGLMTQARAAALARKDQAAQAFRAALMRVMDEVDQADEARLAQEFALLAVKQDVTEELDRLDGHLVAARDMLATGGPVGRKLDFLSQEFNREANTLCSKSQNSALTAVGLDLKAVIDQMREQIQNVE